MIIPQFGKCVTFQCDWRSSLSNILSSNLLGMGIGRVTLIAFSIATIFSIGLTSTLVYAGNGPVFDDNFVHAEWEKPSQPVTLPTFFNSFSSSGLQLFDLSQIPLPGDQQGIGGCTDTACQFIVTNFVDDLDTKIIQIDISWGPLSAVPPSPPNVFCNDSTTGQTPAQFVDGNEIDGFTQLTFECEPNPDWERIDFEKDTATNIQRVQIWTTSFDDIAVGGTYIPIDQTALLLAGVQSISMWMIPVVIAGIGIGVFVIKRRK